jgi:hypothetical protein
MDDQIYAALLIFAFCEKFPFWRAFAGIVTPLCMAIEDFRLSDML